MKPSGRVIELVNISSAINLDSSWGSMAIEILRIYDNILIPGCSRISFIRTEYRPRVFQSLGGTKCRLLTPFPCSRCVSLSFKIIMSVIWEVALQCRADLHEVFRYPAKHQDLQQNRETFRNGTVPYHKWAKMMYINSVWKVIIPIYPHGGELDLPEWQSWPSKKCNTTWFDLNAPKS